jgi:type IV pilus biogenesis protein CpaD/CtpE
MMMMLNKNYQSFHSITKREIERRGTKIILSHSERAITTTTTSHITLLVPRTINHQSSTIKKTVTGGTHST